MLHSIKGQKQLTEFPANYGVFCGLTKIFHSIIKQKKTMIVKIEEQVFIISMSIMDTSVKLPDY